jgi:prepilin-type N-terminal cleavage/methylation domain-containing protein
MQMRHSKQKGFSIVELLIALVAGLIFSGSVVIFTMASMKSNGDYVQSTRLTQELRNTLDLAARDLRRAGYDDDALKYIGNANFSPFAPLRIETVTEADGSSSACVLYAYDRSSIAGSLPGVLEVDNGEARGIRRKMATVNGRTIGVLEYGVSGGGVKPACGDAGLNYAVFPVACSGTWCPLSDSRNLDISNFTVVDSGPATLGAVGTGQMRIRSLDVTVTGRLAGKTDFLRTVRTRVRISADCLLSNFANCNNVAP